MTIDEDEDIQKQQRRLREIFDARKEVAERKQRAFELMATNQLSFELASRFFQEAVETYLIESEQVIRQYLPDSRDDVDGGREELALDVWYDADLGAIDLPNDNREVSGLLEYLELDGEVSATWEEREGSHVGRGEIVTRSESRPIPFHVSKRAWRVCNFWWAEVGMDFDPPQEEDDEGELTIDMIQN